MPQGKALRVAFEKEWQEQEENALNFLDSSALREANAEGLKLTLCENQSRRAEQANLTDNDYIIDLMIKQNMLTLPEEEEADV